jgi:hypothetical protein
MNQIDFTEFLICNKQVIIDDVKTEILHLLNKRKYFKHEFLLEFNHKLKDNMWIILRNYLITKLELNYLQVEELMLECKVVESFLKEELYAK